ncbi:MAG: DUF6293 family protein [Nitrososphaerota archaeon]
MSEVKPRTHVVLTGLDYERIEHGLRMYPGYRVWVVKNANPKKEHLALVEEIDKDILKILESLGYKQENIGFWPVDFYHFDQALVSIYELLLREKKQGREVIVNITSGTKPVSIAATLAAALAKCGVVYFSARKYIRKVNEIVSEGVIPEPIVIAPLFELADVLLPRSKEKIRIILRLLSGKAKNVTEIIRGEEKPLKKDIAKYTYYVNELAREKLIDIRKDGISLTELGKLVGMLVKKTEELEQK